MKKALLSVTLIFLFATTITAQEHKYNRAGMTVLYTTYSDQYDKPITNYYENLTINSRYDINTIHTKSIKALWKRNNVITNNKVEKIYTTVEHKDQITEYLNQNHISRQIISKIFNRREDGSMDLKTIHYRGQYNATDADYLKSISTKRGAEALKETGELLINNSYIAVFECQNIRIEHEDEDDYYKGTTIGYIYKIIWSEELLYKIWDCWIDENTPGEERAARRAAFDKLEIPITLITTNSSTSSVNTNIKAARKNPKAYGNKTEEELKKIALDNLIYQGIYQNYQSFEKKIDNLTLKTSLYDVHPPKAKLGTKEGLSVDNTFYVYENVQDDSGNIKAKRVGVICATNKIADNSRITTGDFEPSIFYQYAGRKLQKGLNITEKKKAHCTVELGALYYLKNNNQIGVNIGLEIDGYSTKYTQYFAGAKGIIDKDGYNIGIYGGYGFRTNNLQLFPLIGIFGDGLMGITTLDEEKSPIATLAQLALKANINIYYPVQLFAQAGYNFRISENEMYIKYKGERNIFGFNASAGIRFCF